MNTPQRYTLALTALAIAVACACPYVRRPGDMGWEYGFQFLLTSPGQVTIQWNVEIAIFAGIIALGTAIYFIVAHDPTDRGPAQTPERE